MSLGVSETTGYLCLCAWYISSAGCFQSLLNLVLFENWAIFHGMCTVHFVYPPADGNGSCFDLWGLGTGVAMTEML